MNSSPTGVPLLPAKAIPFLVALAAILVAVDPFVPDHTIGQQVLDMALKALGFIGLASPGLRKAPVPDAAAMEKAISILKK